MGYYKNKGFVDERKPKKPIQWKESIIHENVYDKCLNWCYEQMGDSYHCWWNGTFWDSNRGHWKHYWKGSELVIFCFRDEKTRLAFELKFG
jgi:hypothetical protein